MAFTLTGLPRFYNLTKTAWDEGVAAEKIEAGAVYFVTDGTETTLYVGKADNAFLTITDPTVVTQITNAIDQIRANDIEFSTDYDYGTNGSNVEAAISYIMENLDAVQGPDGGLGNKMNKLTGTVTGDKLLITIAGEAADIKESEIAIGSIATEVNGVAVTGNKVTIDGGDIIAVEAALDGTYFDVAATDTVSAAFGKVDAAIAAAVTHSDDKFDGHKHVMADITDSNWVLGADKLETADTIVLVDADGAVKESDKTLADFADAGHTHTVEELTLGKTITVDGATVAVVGDTGVTGIQKAIDAIEAMIDLKSDGNHDHKGVYAETVNGQDVQADGSVTVKGSQTAVGAAISGGFAAVETDTIAAALQAASTAIASKVSTADYTADKATFALAANVYSKTEADGKFATIADYSTTAVTNQAIADAKAAVIGTADDAASADTVKGAKAYADSLITDLGAVFEFKGVVANYAALTALTGMEKGDVYLVTSDENQAGTPANAEYVYDGTKWELLGNTALDTTNFIQSTVDLTADKVVLGNGGKGVKASAYGIGGTTTVAGTEYMLATEKAVKADFDALNVDINEIIEYMSWQTTM